MGVGGCLRWLVYGSGCCVSGALGLGSRVSVGLVWCGC